MTRRHRFSRRRLLEHLGMGGAMLPLLEASRSFAQPRAFPTRCVIVLQTNGTIASEFFPRGTGTDLASLTLPRITAPLAPCKSKLTFIEKLEIKSFTENPVGGAHENFSVCFNGARGVPTTTFGDAKWGGELAALRAAGA